MLPTWSLRRCTAVLFSERVSESKRSTWPISDARTRSCVRVRPDIKTAGQFERVEIDDCDAIIWLVRHESARLNRANNNARRSCSNGSSLAFLANGSIVSDLRWEAMRYQLREQVIACLADQRMPG